MDILSFITDDRSCNVLLNEDEPYLHHEHLVISAINMMVKGNLSSVAIGENGKHIGRVYLNELMRFVNWNDRKDPLAYHKLNFDLLTAVTVMKKEW